MKRNNNATLLELFQGNKFKDLCRKNHIRLLSLFGSRVRGDFRAKSDVDLIVKFKGRLSLLDLVHIENELSDMIGKKVDLVTEGSVPAYMKKAIQKEAKPIYEER